MRNVKSWMVALLACGALCLIGCGEEEPATTEPVAETEPEEVVEEPAEPTADEVPVPEDFAAEAESEITDDNYRDELAEIEASLGAEAEDEAP